MDRYLILHGTISGYLFLDALAGSSPLWHLFSGGHTVSFSSVWNKNFKDNTNMKCDANAITQQNSYSNSHLLGTVTAQWLDSDGVVTVDNCRQQGDYTVDQLCSYHAAGS